jgi:putative two-component system response regulator
MTTILLIDDDADFVEATCAVLESVPYRVQVAYAGDEGLISARKSPPDLIILDVIMPMEDGFEILAKLKSDPELVAIPVIMLTSLSDGLKMAPQGDFEIKVEDYLDKPIKPAKLLQRIERLLASSGVGAVSGSDQTDQ